jgi:hypothetical protein
MSTIRMLGLESTPASSMLNGGPSWITHVARPLRPWVGRPKLKPSLALEQDRRQDDALAGWQDPAALRPAA